MNASTLISLPHQLSPTAMHSLGWALLHFLWQGTAVAALAAGAMALCRQASARYAIAVGALVVMLLAPPLTFLLYSQAHSATPTAAQALPHAAGTRSTLAKAEGIGRFPTTPSLDALPWLVEAWLIGVAFFSLRSAGGFLLLERERRRQSSVVNAHLLEICYTLQDRMGIRRAIQYCECKWMQAPAVIGWFRPVVFLPVTALTGLSEEQLESVIAHELAHIRRLDAFVNVFQVCVETLLFYHPAVWWLNQRIRSEREHCCDEMAVTFCGNPVEYARALTLMEEWRSAPGLAMAANRGPLTERIMRVLGLKPFGAAARGIGLAGSALCLTAALVAGNALLGMAHPPSVRASSAWQAMPASFASPAAQAAPIAKPSPAHAQSSEPSQASGAATAASATSYVEAMKKTGLGDLTVDQLIALKIQDVTPEYVRGLSEQGFHLTVEKVIAMRIQDVTPEFIREFRQAGLNPDEDQILSLKIQDADPAYYRAMKDAGIECDVNRLVSMKIQDVTPQYVRDLRAAGLAVTADQVIALKIQDVTPGYLKEMHDLGLELKTDDAIAMRIQDVTPEYVRQIRALGFKPSTNELIAMRIQDVSPEYIKELQSAGFKLDIDEIIGAKIQDVTPEFIEQARKHGFKDLTLQKLIQLRQLGILDPKADL